MSPFPPNSERDLPSPRPAHRRPRWHWLALGLALAWIVLMRVPLVLNAEIHLDSDLAIDGLTLLEATRGVWRWHYPGTPHMGILPVFLSLPQAWIWGVNAFTLVSGGVGAYLLFVVATFCLAWRAFGHRVAAWSLVPMTFASTGMLWLSGRITGGHLLTVAWHAWAFYLAIGLIRRGGIGRALACGLWAGFGLYLDQMMVFTLFGLVPIVVASGFGPGRVRVRIVCALAFAVGLGTGYLPRWIGGQRDPFDAYRTQFQTIFGSERTRGIEWDESRAMASEHARLLLLECLPRLVGGYRAVTDRAPSKEWNVRGLQSEPTPDTFGGRPRMRNMPDVGALAWVTLGLALGLFLVSQVALACRIGSADHGQIAASWGLLVSSLVTVTGFLINRNIYNSDNYRYLVLLMVSWALGFGLFMDWLGEKGASGRVSAGLITVALAALMTFDTVVWYGRLGWLDESGRVWRVPLEEPALDWLRDHHEVDQIFGGYWDVYRLAFLTGGRVEGVPYPVAPDRYDRARHLPRNRPRVMIGRRDGFGPFYRQQALSDDGRVLHEESGVWIIDWP